MFGEKGYLKLVKHILKNGAKEFGRNGTTYSTIGEMLKFDLKNNKIPLMTTKKLAWKTCLHELMWMIRGSTNNNYLKAQGVNIWTGNSTREFLDSRGLTNLSEGDLGPIYGHQWRHYNAKYEYSHSNYLFRGIDQLENVINEIKKVKETGINSRRIIMTAWNPEQIDEMALPPCHVLSQYHVVNNRLSCTLYQRSGDVGLGIPFNIASYSFLTHLLAHHCDMEAGEFTHFIGNCHIYDDHVEMLKRQVERKPFTCPKLFLTDKYHSLNVYDVKNFKIKNYKYHGKIKMDMRS
jgi:thymidylate synthase